VSIPADVILAVKGFREPHGMPVLVRLMAVKPASLVKLMTPEPARPSNWISTVASGGIVEVFVQVKRLCVGANGVIELMPPSKSFEHSPPCWERVRLAKMEIGVRVQRSIVEAFTEADLT
jgi:hypothetical protein